jgi:hypothetical protein
MRNRPTLKLTEEQKKVAAELGRIGGETRARRLTPERRISIAKKASRAAAKARIQAAKAKKGK